MAFDPETTESEAKAARPQPLAAGRARAVPLGAPCGVPRAKPRVPVTRHKIRILRAHAYSREALPTMRNSF
jgi:hypothetical protein